MQSSQAKRMTKHELLYLQELRAVQIQKYQRQHRELSICRTTPARMVMQLIHAIENVWDV
jgi:hypothetical protein